MTRTELQNAVEALNVAILNKDMEGMETAKNELDEGVKQFNLLAVQDHYNALFDMYTPETPHAPMHAAIQELYTEGIKATRKKDKDTEIEEYVLEDKQIQIALSKFAQYGKKSRKIKGITPEEYFFTRIESFNLKMTYRVLTEIGDKKATPEYMKNTYSIRKLERDLEMGKTPLSNTQMLKELQGIVDAIIFVDDGKGNGANVHKVTSHDVAYIRETYARRGRTSGSVVCSKHETLAMLIMDMLHKMVTKKAYVGEFKQRKEKDAGDAQAGEVKTQAKPKAKGKGKRKNAKVIELKPVAKANETASDSVQKAA